ncbi:phage tail assembly protein T [Nonomuraea endophytica]|uniref:phage tail assembly protein T n=1 Tax=Nonomuraea endophytica TaxID=714136 RepID=UPI0037C6294E
MGMPVAELLHRISARELAAWMAFEELHGPVGIEQRLDRVAATIAAAVTGGKVEHFMSRWDVRPVHDEEVAAGGDPA